MRHYRMTVCTLCAGMLFVSATSPRPIYKDRTRPVMERVNDLLSRMTLDEQIGQLNLIPYYTSTDSVVRARIAAGRVGALLKANGTKLNSSLQRCAVSSSRLGIPLMFHEDVIHGYRTIGPIPLGEACSWDRELVEQAAAVAAREAAAAGLQLTYAPMVDVSTDPRWGRIMETSGEDPYLCAELAAARVRGFQGSSLTDPTTVAACVKHYAGYAALSGGRDYQNTEFSYRDLEELYLPPYRAAIAAGVASVMCSYTTYNAVPATHSSFLNRTVLRDELGCEVLLMTDWCTLAHAVEEGAAASVEQSALKGIECGIEMDMSSGYFDRALRSLVDRGEVDSVTVSKAAARCLKLKFEAGLFDDPYRYFDSKREQRELFSDENRAATLAVAQQSMVLLENHNNVLPLGEDVKVALVGPFATERESMLGRWSCQSIADQTIDVATGLQKRLGDASVEVEGCTFEGIDLGYIERAAACAERCGTAVVCLGEPASIIGEGVSTATVELPRQQIELLRRVCQSCERVVVVLFNGRPLCLDSVIDNCDALLEAWYPGSMGGDAVASIVMGDVDPSGRLCQTFPRHAGQIPIFYNMRRTFSTVDHCDIRQGPQYPFGYGLSYTTFSCSKPTLSSETFAPGQKLRVSVTVTNTGSRDCRQTVQLYISHRTLSIVPRSKELKAFDKVFVGAGSSVEVVFELTDRDFEVLGADNRWSVEQGVCDVSVGFDSVNLQSAELNKKW